MKFDNTAVKMLSARLFIGLSVLLLGMQLPMVLCLLLHGYPYSRLVTLVMYTYVILLSHILNPSLF